MTNEQKYPYAPLNRLGYRPPPHHSIARSFDITSADIHDLDDIYDLCKRHKLLEAIPYRDSVRHLLRNPRNVSAIAMEHLSIVPNSMLGETFIEGGVTEETVTGVCVVGPVDTPCLKQNYIRIQIRLVAYDFTISEENLARLIYETIYQYAKAKISTEKPTKLEVSLWLQPTETTLFRNLYVLINALFHQSYLGVRLPDVGYESTSNANIFIPIPSPEKDKYPKAALLKQRRNLNNPQNHQQVKHILIFPCIPAPAN